MNYDNFKTINVEKLKTIAASIALSAIATGAVAQEAASMDYKVVERMATAPSPTAFKPVAATSVKGAFTKNIVTAGQRIFAPDNTMLKAMAVGPVGGPEGSAWKLGSDEGGTDHEQTAPNPLSYLSAGIAANLYTSLQQAVTVLDLAIDDMKVEAKVDFSWHDPFAPDWAGFTDRVTANIVIKSDESPEKIAALKDLALKGWIAGEGLANATKVDVALAVNGTHWDDLHGTPGSIPDPVSVDDGFTLSKKMGTPQLDTIDPGKDFGGGGPMSGKMPKLVEFSVVATVTSANDAKRPYLQRINVRAMQDNYTGWELFADDSFETDGPVKAPSSLDYLAAGTSHCLMSQMAITPMALKLDIPDFRAEHQFNFRQDGAMTTDMAGFVDDLTARIVVKSDEPMEALEQYFNLSLRLCFAGEAWTGKTDIISGLYVNGTRVD